MTASSDFETPCYVFDEVAVARRVGLLRQHLPAEVRLCYAMKANPFVLGAASRVTDYVEACSPGELSICRAVGIPASKMVVSGIYKELDVMAEVIGQRESVHRITVESPAQFRLIEALAARKRKPISLLMRLTSGNQFGMDVDDMRDLLLRANDSPYIDVCGIQYFSGTQKSSPRRLVREAKMLDEIISDLSDSCGIQLRELEYGPGLPISYCDDDEQERLDRELLSALADSMEAMSFRGTKTLEIGRSMVAPCGTYVTSVVDVKRNQGQWYAVVDGGKHQVAYYGPALALKAPVFHVSSDCPPKYEEDWAICGSLCTTADLLVKQAHVHMLHVGDRIVFHNAGAYCATEAMALFLSRDLPRVYLRGESGEMRLVRPRVDTSLFNTPIEG